MDNTIITGQYVRIDQTPASAGERLLALAIDDILLLLTVIGLFKLHDILHFTSELFVILLCAFIVGFYSLLCEIFNNGQSVGKRLMHLRVTHVDGSEPTIGSAGGTMVIKEKDYRRLHVSLDEFDYLTKDYSPVYPQAADLSLEQVNVITRTLQTYNKEREARIAQLSRKVIDTLRLPAGTRPDEMLLQTLVRDYQYYALEEI